MDYWKGWWNRGSLKTWWGNLECKADCIIIADYSLLFCLFINTYSLSFLSCFLSYEMGCDFLVFYFYFSCYFFFFRMNRVVTSWSCTFILPVNTYCSYSFSSVLSSFVSWNIKFYFNYKILDVTTFNCLYIKYFTRVAFHVEQLDLAQLSPYDRLSP